MLAVAGGGGDSPAVAAVAAPIVGIAVAHTADADAAAEARGGRRRVSGIGARASAAGAGRRRVRRVQRKEVLLQPHAHRVRGVVTQGQYVKALLGLPDVQPQILGGAVLLRLVPTDGRIH